MKTYKFVSSTEAITADTPEEFISKMTAAGFEVKKVFTEADTKSPNPIYDFSWMIGCPDFKGILGPMNDMGTMRYETQEVYDTLSR